MVTRDINKELKEKIVEIERLKQGLKKRKRGIKESVYLNFIIKEIKKDIDKIKIKKPHAIHLPKYNEFGRINTTSYYLLDLFFPEYSLAIECDEIGHRDRCKNYEKQRQKFCESKGVMFLRFNPDSKYFDVMDFVNKVKKHLT